MRPDPQRINNQIQERESPVSEIATTFRNRLNLLNNRPDSKQKRRSFVSEIIEYFIIDATYESMENLLTIN